MALRRRRFELFTSKQAPFAITGAAVVVMTLVWALPGQWKGVALTDTLIAFILFVVLADLLEVPLERQAAFSLGLAPGLAYALLARCVTADASENCGSWIAPTLGEVIFVFALGSCLAMALRWVIRRPVHVSFFASRLLVVAAAAESYRLVNALTPDALTFGPTKMSIPGLGVVLVVVCATDILLQSLLVSGGGVLRRLVREKTRETGPLLLSTVSVAALLALAYPVLDLWTIPILLAPLAATQFSFRQVATIRRNSLQTVRALAKVPEMAGYTQRGHSSRVTTLAVHIAEELDVVRPELHDIEYAALLHDIGRVSLTDPEDVSGTISQLELALVGAEIVEKTGHFTRVVRMIASQHEPYRRRGEEANRGLPLGAKIIKVASAYDDLTEPPGPGRTPLDALERLHLEMAYEYDPQVIQALRRVLEKRGLV